MKKNLFSVNHIYATIISLFKGLFFLSTLFTSTISVFAKTQNQTDHPPLRGLPGISHYTREDFNADPQFWAVCEDKEGVLYFGNNDGAIVFDGERWYKVNLPNNSSIRCLTTDQEGNIYAGGFNEFGTIIKDPAGGYFYKSLFDTLKFEDKTLENLWQVHALQNTIIYRSFSNLIVITGSKVTKLPAKSNFTRSYVIDNRYYVQDGAQGIFLLDTERMQFIPIFTPDQYNRDEIISLLPTRNNTQVIAVGKSGKLYEFNLKTRVTKLWKSIFKPHEVDQIECAIQSNDSTYYLGTLGSGIVTLDSKGNVYRNEENFGALQDKTVLNLFKNKSGNVWALLNNGLDCINFNSPVSTLFDSASPYDVLIQDQKMYLATNQGIFFTDSLFKLRPEFKKLRGLEGQGWSLQVVEGDILVGHDKGLYHIDGTEALKIGDQNGIWKVIKVKEKEGFYLALGYDGLYLISKLNTGKWQFLRKIEGFNESSRDILATDTPGTYWVCHGYKGVFRINIDNAYSRVTSLEHFTTQNGLPFAYNVNVFSWKGTTVFTTNYGIYTFDYMENKFKPFEPLNNLLDSTENTRKIVQHEGKTWFVQDDEVGFFEGDSSSLETEYFLQFKGTFNRGMDCIIPLPNDQILLGTKTGLYLYDLKFRNNIEEVKTKITSVRYLADQKENRLPLSPVNDLPTILPNTTSLVRFEFSAPAMQHNAAIQYAYKLENLDDEWSPWQNASFIEYNHLRPGKYSFKVKSRSLLGIEGSESFYHFEILPVWYQTTWAWIVYLLLATILIVSLIYLIQKKIADENYKTREEEQKARKLLELELQQMRLKSEKEKISQDKELLEEDVIHKSKELANYTMLLVKKREVIYELREDLKELREFAKNEGSRKKVREMISKISQHMTDEEYLNVFEANFEKVHQDFFDKLRQAFPDLTQRELRLCAFVKMNLTNKEIAPMLNISVRGVETARYRIRKKINLEHEHNLVEYLENLSPTSQDVTA